MKLTLTLTLALLLSLTSIAQQGINYKALIKDGGGNVVANQSITVQFIIYEGIALTNNVYQETHTPNTDANGIVILNIGEGATSDVFTDIDWEADDHFFNIQINTGNGLTDLGTTQFMAVPYALSVSKETIKINDLVDGKSDNDGSDDGSSVFLGIDAGLSDVGTNNQSVGIGFHSLKNCSLGFANIAIGFKTLFNNYNGEDNVAIGWESLYRNTYGSSNTANGYQTLFSNTEGYGNTANGARALLFNQTGEWNTAIGESAGINSIGSGNVFLGHQSGYNETSSNKLYIENSDADADNALIYGEFGTDNTTTDNILRTNSEFQIGNPTGTGFAFPKVDGTIDQVLQTDGDGALSWVNGSSLGSQKINDLTDGKSDDDGSDNGYSLFLGIGAGTIDDGSSNRNIGIGFQSLYSVITGAQNTAVGFQALRDNTGTQNNAIGHYALRYNSTGNYNTAVGFYALFENLIGERNTATGNHSLRNNLDGERNTATGYAALFTNSSGLRNTANGYASLYSNTIGIENTALGNYSLNENIDGNYNTASGNEALRNNTGSQNTAHGSQAGYNNSTGNGNIFLGYQSGYNETNNNKLYIENSNANADNALIYGDFGTNNTTTGNILRTNSEFQIGNPTGTGFAFPSIDGTANQVLRTNGSGGLSWTNAGLEALDEGNGFGWRLIGRNPANYGNIGLNAVDLSYSNSSSTTRGASGGYSTAMGFNTTASGTYSTAMGFNTNASGLYSRAMGHNTTASGAYSTAMGTGTTASGSSSIAMGHNTTASGSSSVAIGFLTTALNSAIAMGISTTASGDYSTTMGFATTASGSFSTAMSNSTTASGNYSTAMGRYTKSEAENVFAIGRYNIGGGNATTWISTDKLFEAGNGTSEGSRANAFTILKNGKVGIGTHTPNVKLQITGGTDASLSNGSGYIVIGDEADENLVIDGNEIMARNDGITSVLHFQANGGTVWVGGAEVHSSDRRLKKDIVNIPYGLNEILQLQPKAYNWRNREQKKKSLGLIAQDVQFIIKEIVTVQDNEERTLGISYTELIPVLIKAIQEQQDIIEEQNSKIVAQSSKLENQDVDIKKLMQRMQRLENITNK